MTTGTPETTPESVLMLEPSPSLHSQSLPPRKSPSQQSTVNSMTLSKPTILPDLLSHSLATTTVLISRPASSHLPSSPLTCALLPTLSPPRTTNRFLLDSRWSRPTSQNSLFLWLTAPMHGLTSRSSRTGTTTGSSKVR